MLGLRVALVDGIRVLLTVGLLEGTAVGLLLLLALCVGRKLDLLDGSLLCSVLEEG